jgi:glycerol-3-phosphate acyltransferase PlsY
MMSFLIFGVIAYLLGSIPSAVWVGKKWYGVDVREAGSKNSGATNTFRLLGKKAGIIVLLLDIFKGLLAVILPVIIFNSEFQELMQTEVIHVQIICAITAVFGHVFPLFASFKGGKGVATSLGIVIGIHPPTALLCLLIFLVIFVITSYVSFGAIISALLFPVMLIFVFTETDPWLITFSLVLSLAVILAHRKNIGRLLKGEENKMKLFKK